MDLLIPLALAALLIFFLFNSRRKQKARAEQIKTGLVPGATVMTTFGVFGTVLSIDDENNQVTLESGPGTILRVHRQAIGQINNPETDAGTVDGAAAGTPDVSADDESSDAPAITDAELDAMNERKRAENGSDDADLDAGEVDDIESALTAESEQNEADAASSANEQEIDEDTVSSEGSDDDVDGPGTTDADASGTDASDPENKKKN